MKTDARLNLDDTLPVSEAVVVKRGVTLTAHHSCFMSAVEAGEAIVWQDGGKGWNTHRAALAKGEVCIVCRKTI